MTAADNDRSDRKVIYWHSDLPPLDAEQAGEHVVDATSLRVKGNLEQRGELWDRCHDDLMTRVQDRLEQEVSRLGGHDAHVLRESIDSRRDDASGEGWLHGRFSYLLVRRPEAH